MSGALLGGGAVTVYGTVSNDTVMNYGIEYIHSGGLAIDSVLNSVSYQYLGDGYSFAGGTASGTVINNLGKQFVYSGGVSIGSTINNGGAILVSGGTVDNVSVQSGGSLTIYSGSEVNSGSVASGGSISGLIVSSGAVVVNNGNSVIDGVTIHSGANVSLEIGSGAAISGLSINSGMTEQVDNGGLSEGDTVNSGAIQFVLSGGTGSGANINGGFVSVYGGTTSGNTVNSGGMQTVYSGGQSIGTVINAGGLDSVASSGEAINFTVNSGGFEEIYSGGLVSGGTVNTGGRITGLIVSNTINISSDDHYQVDGVNIASGVSVGLSVSAGGKLTGFVMNSGGSTSLDGGILAEATVNNGGQIDDFYGLADATTINSGGVLWIYSGGSATNLDLNSGASVQVYSGGVISGGSVADNATISGLVLSAGNVVASGGTYVIDGLTIQSGAIIQLIVESGATITGFTANSGGSDNIDSGSVANNTTVNWAGNEQVNSGGTSISTLLNRGLETVQSGGLISGATVDSGGSIFLYGLGSASLINSGGQELVQSGGVESYAMLNGGYLDLNGKTISATVNSGGLLYIEPEAPSVKPGGIASATTVNSGGVQTDYGLSMATVINSGGVENVYGVASSVIVNGGGTESVFSGGILSGATINNGAVLSVGGQATADNVLVLSGGIEDINGGVVSGGSVASGGTISGLVLSAGSVVDSNGAMQINGVTLQNGAIVSLEVRAGATMTGFLVNSGGTELVDNGAITTSDTINNGGNETLYGQANADTVNSGGTLTVYGTVNGLTVNSGGIVVLETGSIESHISINGGVVELASNPGVNESVTFTGNTGYLFLADPAHYSGVISGFNGSDVIVIPDTTTSVSSVSWNAGDLHVTGSDGSTLNLSLPGNFQGLNFGLLGVENQWSIIGIEPTPTHSTYNAQTGVLTVNGANLSTNPSDYNAITVTIKGDGGLSYTLGSASVLAGQPTSTAVLVQLSANDQLAVDGLLNKNGTIANDGTTAYQLSVSNGAGSPVETVSITASNVSTPIISAVSYNAMTGVFTFTGNSLVNHGSLNGITLSDFRLTGGSGAYAFNASKDTVNNFSATGFTVTLGSGDQALVNAILNADGNKALTGTAYSLSASAHWDGDSSAAISTQSITVSGAPTLTAVSYNAASGILTLTGSDLSAQASAYQLKDISLKGDGGVKYTLTGASSLTASASSVAIQLLPVDQLAVDGLLNNNGLKANDNTVYNLSTTSGWLSATPAISTEAVSVSNVGTPAITAVSYNAATGVFTFSGSGFANHGTSNGIAANDFRLSGGSTGAYTFNASTDIVSNLTANSFNITLSSADKTLVNAFVNIDGISPLSGAAYNLSAAAHWDSDSGGKISSQAVTVSNAPPLLKSVSYNAATGILTLSGGNFTASASDYHLSNLTLTGDAGSKYTLTAGSTVVATLTSNSVAIQLSTADQLAVDGLLNKNGTVADNGSLYNLAASAGWDSSATAINTQSLTVSNVSPPTITAVSYNAITGVFSFSGANLDNHGSSTGITLNDLKFNVSGSAYTFSTSNDVLGNFSANGFTVTLNNTDQATVNTLLAVTASGQSDKISAVANWDSDSGAAINNQSVTVSGVPIRILATTGLNDPRGIALDSSGNLFIADTGDNAIKELLASSHVLNKVSTSTLTAPAGVAVYNNTLYIADSGANLVYQQSIVSISSTKITITGNTLPGGEVFMDPVAIASYKGNVYFSDTGTMGLVAIGGPDIQEVSGGKTLTTIISSGMQLVDGKLVYTQGVELSNPTAITFDSSGNLYIADAGANAIDELASGSSKVTQRVSTGLSSPDGIAVDSAGNLYIADSGDNAIKELVAGSQTLITLLATGLNNPQGLAIDSNGNLYVANSGDNQILEMLHSSYLFNSALQTITPEQINNLWENTGQIQLSKAIYTAFAGQTAVSAANFSNAAVPTSTTDYLYYNSSTGGLYYDAHGSATSNSAVEIAVVGVNNHPAALGLGDFKLTA